MPEILLSNDDGVFAPGLRALTTAFLADGWRVTVAAPDGERSAASHGITIKRPLVATKVHYDGVPKGAPLTVWAVDGTPADCVKLALHKLCEARPTLVVSGINNGWNVGTDVHYSGTVGAAMEAAFEGVQAIAVSTMQPDEFRYANAAKLAVETAHRLLKHPLTLPSILNLNLPDCEPNMIRGIVEAPLTRIQYTDSYIGMEHKPGRSAYWLRGEIIEEGCDADGDLAKLLQGYATATLLGWDLGQPGGCTDLLQEE